MSGFAHFIKLSLKLSKLVRQIFLLFCQAAHLGKQYVDNKQKIGGFQLFSSSKMSDWTILLHKPYAEKIFQTWKRRNLNIVNREMER